MGKKRCSGAGHFPVLFAFLVAGLSLLALPAAADLAVKADKEVYNFGDGIVASYGLSGDQDFNGLVKLSLYCTGFVLDFYTLPTNLFAGEKQQVDVPGLSISPIMLGRCFVAANATAYDLSVNETAASDVFNVTRLLSVAVEVGKLKYLPSETVEAFGAVGKSHFLPAAVSMAFLGTAYAASVDNNSFAYSIRLPGNIKSGLHGLEFAVNDSYGNSGSASAQFEVEAVPTRIVNAVSSQNIKPSEPFAVAVSVYDQADDMMESSVDISVTDSAGSVVLSASNRTGENITLVFPAGQKPGTYALASFAFGLSAASQLVVERVEEAAVSFTNRSVVLRNTGNVNYARKFNITLAGRKSYVIAHDVELAPGEAFEVDLTDKVSEGSYNISFPTIAGSSPVENAFLEDERPLLKKASDFVGITGRAVKLTASGTGKVQARFAPVLLFAMVAVLAFFFVKNRGKGGTGSKEGGGSVKSSREENFGSGVSGGSSGDKAAVSQSSSQPSDAEVEARIRRIIEEKRRQLSEPQRF
ncbi:hypothetical protein HYU17_03185 [Candidatus Woesearchaeota archaeon]|nr:hypothetical protein [Candidatus Woesearchaeota archaeon]